MDRKSKPKIGYLLISLVFLIIMGILFGFIVGYENRLLEEQRQELEIIYPEIESEVQDNFTYYQKQLARTDAVFFGVMVVMIILLCLGFFLLYKRESNGWEEQIKEEAERVYLQLQRFHQGEFQMLPEMDEIKDMEEQDVWLEIYEKLRELGYYFSDMKERLADEENSTKALITDISHQLKTPLASIRMCHELAGSEDLTKEERNEFLETETREIHRLELLLDELVKLSRLENNMIQLRLEVGSLKQTISEAVGQVFMKAHEKEIEISVEMETDVEIAHDRKWTVEAFVNVLENAVKYSEIGTDITIRGQFLSNNVLVEVEDEGMGISEEELHKIFCRFYRGNKAKEQVKEGAGVGLYLARSIIERQDGTIIAKRKQEKGSIFKIMLPLH